MLRFAESPSPAGLYMFRACLELAADAMTEHYADMPTHFAADYPLCARWTTPQQAVEILNDVLHAFDQPDEYTPTDYHWCLIYEAVIEESSGLNAMALDGPLEDCWIVPDLRALATGEDRFWLHLSAHTVEDYGQVIDARRLMAVCFWDMDFLGDAERFANLPPEAKRMLDANEELFGVLHGLVPHPDELRLTRTRHG